ncbi:COG1361 S-layer family protein [Allofournierella massiliensis]|uniref:COG1361 S-layer family protein n=1 Tax=Allofournierella massiliensis TaxID=1650663 RepID=UPI003565BF87
MKQSIKRISAVLAMAMALSAFSAFGVFAEGESTSAPASVPQSTSVVAVAESNSSAEQPTPTPEPDLTPAPEAYISSYRVKGYDGDHFDKGERADIEVTVVDERAAATGAKITARTNTPSFSANTNKDNGGNGDGTYTFIFRNVEYLGGSTEFSFEMIYSDGAPMQTLLQNFSMCVDTPEPTPTPEPVPTEKPEYDYPKILVKDFSFGGNSVEAGKEFTLQLTLFTTSGNANLQDVMVGLNFGELKGVSLASGSMNTYVGEMAPNTTKTISYKMITDATIEPGAISINVNLSSKNGEATTSPISIPVTQPERFDITNMEAPETIMMGEEGYLSVTFVNKGKSAINNLSAEIQGDNLANPGQSQFLGNIAAGTENSVDFSVLAAAEGTINGKVILSYEDAKGEVKTLEKEFSCTVEPMMDMGIDPMDPGMMDPTMTETTPGMPIWGWVLIVVGVAAVVVVVVVVVKKKQKAKKLAQLEDEDEDI